MADGAVRPVVTDRVFPLPELAAAHRWMEENRAVGMVVADASGET